jgi:hypothetical protein
LPPTLIAPLPQDTSSEELACLSDTALTALSSVPPGMILSDANIGSFLLNETPHSVM